jgi:hypothetical protein
MSGFSSHEKTIANHHDWITPKSIIDALGLFDLDPCQSKKQPWPCARRGYTITDDGLSKPWAGCVWLNPPYGRFIGDWVRKLVSHGNGVALMFARTDTKWFQDACSCSSAMLFLRGRVRFHDAKGKKFQRQGGGASATAPSVLIAFGNEAKKRLLDSSLDGIRVIPRIN